MEALMVAPHSAETTHRWRAGRTRPLIAFFDYPDVFEDFYPRYGVTQQSFATHWANTGNHAFVSILQKDVGDVVWYSFSLKPELYEARHEVIGCKVRFLESSWMHRTLWKLFYLPKAAWRWRRAYPLYAALASYLAPLSPKFFNTLREEPPDFIFIQDYSSGKFDVLSAVSLWLDAPLVTYHSGSEIHKYIGRSLRRWTLPHAHRVIASGKRELEIVANYFKVPPERLLVILTPINTETYRPVPREVACRAAGLDLARRYLLFLGRLDETQKRVSAIVTAFGRLRNKYPTTDLLIAGDGSDRQKTERTAAECAPGRTHFLGWIKTPHEKAQLYSLAECMVLASAWEGFPTVVGEAMACGTPVISSRMGAVEELIVDDRTGWLFPVGDDEALVNAMDRI